VGRTRARCCCVFKEAFVLLLHAPYSSRVYPPLHAHTVECHLCLYSLAMRCAHGTRKTTSTNKCTLDPFPPPPTPHTHLWWSVRCAPLRVVVLRYPVWSMSWTWHVLSCRRLTLLPSRHPNGRARCVPGQGRMLSLLAFAVLISPHMFNSARFVGTTEGGGRGRGVARA
jgi:hypothetical protein